MCQYPNQQKVAHHCSRPQAPGMEMILHESFICRPGRKLRFPLLAEEAAGQEEDNREAIEAVTTKHYKDPNTK